MVKVKQNLWMYETKLNNVYYPNFPAKPNYYSAKKVKSENKLNVFLIA